jgi:Flp pilus assembly protein TadG
MTATKTLKSLLKRFATDQKGSLTVMVGLTGIPLMVAAGVAIDYVRLNAAQTHVQAALDAATLSAASARKATDDERIAIAEVWFKQNVAHGPAAGMKAKPKFKVVKDRVVSDVELKVPTALMNLVGINVMDASSHAEVSILKDKKAEIALVLDYSGSMGDPVDGKTKYVSMREAAKSLVEDLSKSDPEKVKFGLVPFSHLVHTTLPGAYVLGGSGTWTGCTQDRKSPYNVKTSTPTTDPETQWNQPLYDVDPDQLTYTCKGFVKHKLKMVDLTDKFKDVTDQLNVMTPYGYTHIALGVEFGYHMLSPNAPFSNGAGYNDKDTKKFLVVLTDGAQTAGAFGPDGKRSPDEGRANLETLCSNAKADGITIITMAFDLYDVPTRTRLKNCATDPAKDFFSANDAVALTSAFESVKAAITAEVFLSK